MLLLLGEMNYILENFITFWIDLSTFEFCKVVHFFQFTLFSASAAHSVNLFYLTTCISSLISIFFILHCLFTCKYINFT